MIILFIVGLSFIMLGLFLLLDDLLFRQKARQVEGHIVGFERTHSSKGEFRYLPIFQYTDQGDHYQFHSSISSSHIDYDIGEKVDVLILENMHSSARAVRGIRLFIASAFVFMGSVSFVFSLYELENVEYRSLAVEIGLLLVLVGVYVLLQFSNRYRRKEEAKFSYTPNDEGLIGYEPLGDFITTQVEVNKRVISQKQHLFGILIGIALLMGSLYWADCTYDYIAVSHTVSGTIVGDHSSFSDGTVVHAAMVEFTPLEFSTQHFTSKVSSSSPSWNIGDSINVLYDPQNINDAMIDRGIWNYAIQIIMGLIAILVLSVSSYQYMKKSKKD